MNKAGLGKSQPVKIGKICEYASGSQLDELGISSSFSGGDQINTMDGRRWWYCAKNLWITYDQPKFRPTHDPKAWEPIPTNEELLASIDQLPRVEVFGNNLFVIRNKRQ